MKCFKRRILRAGWACTLVALACSRTVNAGSHSWDFTEVFSTADGSIQFIELMETNGLDGEIALAGGIVLASVEVLSGSLDGLFGLASVENPGSAKNNDGGMDIVFLLNEFGFEQFELEADGAQFVAGEQVGILLSQNIRRGSQDTVDPGRHISIHR